MTYQSGLGAGIAYTGGATALGYTFGTSGRSLITGKAPATQTIVYQSPTAKLPVITPIPTSVFVRPAPVLKFPTATKPLTPYVPPVTAAPPTPIAPPSFSTSGTGAGGMFAGGSTPEGTTATDGLSSFTKSPLLLIAIGLGALLLLDRKGR